MLKSYQTPTFWDQVRFSDEVHYDYGSRDPLYIIWKSGERYCPDCIQREEGFKEIEQKKVHAWAVCGYGFKSAIQFYQIPGNTNGKMSLQGYRDQILESIVKSWIQRSDDFVLKEDDNSGHDTGKSNIIHKWKAENQLKAYFNCASSPDLSPIENCWQPTKQELYKHIHWDVQIIKDLIQKAWDQKVHQDFINSRTRSVPLRLKQVIETEGQFATQEWVTKDLDPDTDYWIQLHNWSSW